MKRDTIIARLRNEAPHLRRCGVEHLAMFGSRARGDERPDSDLDILLDVPRGARFSLVDLVGVEQLVTEAVGISANGFMKRSLDPSFRSTIESDVIEVL